MGGAIPWPASMSIYWRLSLWVVLPFSCIFQLNSSLVGPGSHLFHWNLQPASGCCQFLIVHWYILLFNFLYLSPIFSSSWSCPLFLSLLSLLGFPPTTCCGHPVPSFFTGLKQLHPGLPPKLYMVLWVVSWVLWASGLISTSQRTHTMCVLLWLCYLILTSSIHLLKNFM